MTDLIERVDAAFTEHDAVPAGYDLTDHGSGASEHVGTARPLQVVLCVALGGSAVLLFAMTSGHLRGLPAAAGIVAALAQVALAVGALTRPSRVLFAVAAASNVAIAAFWFAVAGTHGISSATVAIGASLSALVVLVAAALAVRPALGSTWSSGTTVIGSLVPLSIAVVAIAGLFATTIAASAPAVTRRTTAAGGAAAASALAGTVTVPGENSKTFQSIVAGNATEQSELQKWVPLNAADQSVLTGQLSGALQAAERFPTVASAKAAGMILAGGMAPGVGAHYQLINADVFKGINPDGSVNPEYPASWIYASVADNAPVVGVMYESLNSTAPSGFIGPNDHWHRHANVCIQIGGGKIGVPFAADQDVTPQECADVHGQFLQKTVWMVHAWVVPGWESPQGVFSHDNLHVYCPGNTDLTDAIGFCTRQS